jgi:dephospho-CoA kinase
VIRIGLTGSIGMGKSAVAAMFAREGVPIFDADAEVHRLQGPGGALVQRIEARFPGTTAANGVNRQKLGALVLGNPTELRALEAIIHPAVFHARRAFLKRHSARTMVVLDIPLLFEKTRRPKALHRLDATITVSAPLWIQAKRVLRRPGMSSKRFNTVRALQIPDHEKRRRADYVIETGRHKHQTLAAVRRLITCLTPKKGR